MKRYSKLLTVFMKVVVFLYLIFCSTQVVYAANHVSGDNVVYRESAPFVQLNFPFVPNVGEYKYYVDDATGIPSGGGYYFWAYGNDKFGAIQQNKLFTYVLNNGLGLTVSDTRLAELVNAYYGSFLNLESGYLFDGQGNKLGICLNDITGCIYELAPNETDITVPSTETNNIYNWYHYYITTVSPETPDYINVSTISKTTAINLIDVSNSRYNAAVSALNAADGRLNLWLNVDIPRFNTASYGYGFYSYDISECSFYCNNSSSWSNFCSAYSLVNNGDVVSYTDLITNTNTSDLYVVPYNNNDLSVGCDYVQYYIYTNGNYGNDTTGTHNAFELCKKNWIPIKDGKSICIYKDSPVFTSIVNKTYAPTTFTSSTYNNFDTNTTQNMNTNTSVVNNSSNTNSSIYNDASQSFQDYYSNEENYNIDNSVVIQNTTEIIYNYYGDGDNPNPNPNPDDDDDDPIWDALLKAIVDFFKKIGQLIAALLTGLLELINTVLDAFANINNSFEGIKNFLSSIFSWFPSEIVTLMVLGLGLALLASFITWFKR